MFRTLVAGLLAGAALVPLAAQAQVRNLDGESSTVRVFPGEVGSAPAVFEVTVPAATTLRIDAITTSDLDPMLKVTDVATGEMLGEDDDSGGDLNARVTIRSGEQRRLRIEVSSFTYEGAEDDELSGGAFDLRLAQLAYDPQAVRNVAWGSSESGTLEVGDVHEFTFAGQSGKLLEVALRAEGLSDLDPYLELRDPNGEVVVSNDDDGQGLNSLLRHVMQHDGTYTIAASGYADSTGDYTLVVAPQREVVAQAPLQEIGFGTAMTGQLGTGVDNASDPLSIDYRLSDAAIDTIVGGSGAVTFRMTGAGEDDDFGGALDPFLELGLDTPLGFAVIESDDDGAGDLNALLPVDLAAVAPDREMLSRLRLRARGLNAEQLGSYTVTMTEGLEERVTTDYEESDEVVDIVTPATY